MAEEKQKVLIIDERDSSRRSISLHLKKGYDCRLAENFEKGRKILDVENIIVVLLGIRLPDVAGIDAFRIIKETKPNVKVVYLTNYASRDLARQALEEGSYGYLIEPFDPSDLCSVVDNAVEKVLSVRRQVSVIVQSPKWDKEERDKWLKFREWIEANGAQWTEVVNAHTITFQPVDNIPSFQIIGE